jgi:hypothetical protein
MPTNRLRRARTAQTLDCQHIWQLVDGTPLLAGTGFAAGIPNGCNGWSTADWRAFDDAAREGWRQHGAAFMAWWRRENEAFTAHFPKDPRKADAQPWALEMFGEPH